MKRIAIILAACAALAAPAALDAAQGDFGTVASPPNFSSYQVGEPITLQAAPCAICSFAWTLDNGTRLGAQLGRTPTLVIAFTKAGWYHVRLMTGAPNPANHLVRPYYADEYLQVIAPTA